MKKSALFVDFDNIYLELKKKDEQQAEYFAFAPGIWLKKLMGDERKILVRRCYLNPTTFWRYRQQFVMAGFDAVDCPPLTAQGKNAADMHMLMDIMDKLHHATRFDEFILLSADSDFTPVLLRLREHDRETCIVHSGPLSQAYRASADCVLDFQSLYDEEYVGSEAHGSYASEFIPHAQMPVLSQELKHEIVKFLVSTLKTSPSPIPTAKLITLLSDQFGEIATAWFGRGKIGTLFDELEMEKMGVCFDPRPPGQVYLPALHSLEAAPRGAWTADEPDREIVSLAHKLRAVMEMPDLSKADFRACFTFLAAQMKARADASVPGSLSEYARALRDFANEKGMPMARSEATSFLYMLKTNGMSLEGNPRYSAEELAAFYIRGVLFKCGQNQCELDETEKAALFRWLLGTDNPDIWSGVAAAASTLLAGAGALALGLK